MQVSVEYIKFFVKCKQNLSRSLKVRNPMQANIEELEDKTPWKIQVTELGFGKVLLLYIVKVAMHFSCTTQKDKLKSTKTRINNMFTE